MPIPRHVHTERLELRAADPADTDELFGIFNDPEGWWYEPESRHLDPARTRAFLERAASRWDEGLSYWTVRLRDTGDAIGPTVIGLGGALRHRSGGWNLSYRIATSEQGHGYATELSRAAAQAAAQVDDSVPFLAWVAEHNVPSRRVAERLGLVEQGLRIDANDGQARLAYADRELDDERYPRA